MSGPQLLLSYISTCFGGAMNDHAFPVGGQAVDNSLFLLAGSQQPHTAPPEWPCWRYCWTSPLEVCLSPVSILTGVRAMRTIAFHSHNGSFLKITNRENEWQ